MTGKISAALLCGLVLAAGPAFAASFSAPASPIGVTYQPLGTAQGYGPQRMQPVLRNEVTFADAKGLTLYQFDKDDPEKSNCVGDCLQQWTPLVPLPQAKPVPGWTIISRGDGTKQWAHNGRPLYTSLLDKEGGDILGLGAPPEGARVIDDNSTLAEANNYGRFGQRSKDPCDFAHLYVAMAGRGHPGLALTAKLPPGWSVHKLTTCAKSALPDQAPVGFEIKEVTDAAGVVLVDVRNEVWHKVMYSFDGNVDDDRRSCAGKAMDCPAFLPAEVPQAAKSLVPGWTIVERKDGLRQWAYKGKPLYSFEGDRMTGDVNGADQDPRWQVAAIFTYFRPANVGYRNDPEAGVILTTDQGLTLYRRDLNAFLTVGTRIAHDYPYRPRVGRMIRSVACDSECEKTWIPYFAPADAEASGYWGVYVHSDGKKQWTYKDFPLYSYVNDHRPGDKNGDMIYDTRLSDDPKINNDDGFPALYKAGFNFGIARF